MSASRCLKQERTETTDKERTKPLTLCLTTSNTLYRTLTWRLNCQVWGTHPERHPVALQVQVDGAAGHVRPRALRRHHQPEALLDGHDAQRFAGPRRKGVRLLGPQLRCLRTSTGRCMSEAFAQFVVSCIPS